MSGYKYRRIYGVIMAHYLSDWSFSPRAVFGPVTSLVLTLGIILILLGVVLQTGVWAGMFGIVGAMFVTIAVIGRLLIGLSRQL
jgi:hypothetical protein